MVDKRPLTTIILHEGNINTILGVPGSGKTNFAAHLMEQGVKYGIHFATNIHFFKLNKIETAIALNRLPALPSGSYIEKPNAIQTCTVISDMFLHILNGGKNCVFLDEAGIFASSTSPMSKRVKQVKELAYVIRHLNSSFVLIGQAKKSIAPDLRNTLVTYEMRMKRVSATYRAVYIYKSNSEEDNQSEEVQFRLVDKIGRIPLTRLPWDGYFIPKFDFDIDLHDAFNKLGDYDSVEILDHAKDIILELKEEAQAKAQKPKESAYDVRARAKVWIEEAIAEDPTLERKVMAVRLADAFNRSLTWAYRVLAGFEF